jgi:hypothetical protein
MGLNWVWVYFQNLRAPLAAGEIIMLFTRNMDRKNLLNLIHKTEPKPVLDEMRIPALSRLIHLVIAPSKHQDEE